MSRARMKTWRNVVVTTWPDAADVDDVDRLHLEALACHRSKHLPVGLVLTVLETAPPSPSDARERAQAMLRELGHRVGFVAIVLSGSGGFRTAAVRAMFTGISTLIQPKFAWRIVASIDELVDWVPMGMLGTSASIAELTTLTEQMRREISRAAGGGAPSLVSPSHRPR